MKGTDCILIGGGMMGLSTALHLARAGKRVTVLEKEFVGKHASGVNAGGVRSLKRDVAELPLIHGALDMWHNMDGIVGSDCGFYQTGYLIAAESDSAMAELEERAAMTRSLGYDNEIVIDRKRLRQLAPIVRDHCVGGIMSEMDGHAMPAQTCRAFHAAVEQAGGTVLEGCEVLEVKSGANGFAVHTATHGVLHAEQVVNCAGAWAGRVAAMVGDDLPVEAVGASVLVSARMPRLLHHFVAVHGRKLWFNQARNGTLLICGGYYADVDEKTFETTMNFHTLQACVQVAHDLFAIADDVTIVRTWAGVDGETPDLHPLIDRSPSAPGMFHLCGFSKHGFALSPMVGKQAAEMVMGRMPEVDMTPFSLGRFGK